VVITKQLFVVHSMTVPSRTVTQSRAANSAEYIAHSRPYAF